MRRTLILAIPFVLALPATTQGQDRPWHRDHRGDFFGKGHGFLLGKFLGDATPEQKEALKALGKELLEGARPYFPALRDEVKALHEQVRAALSQEEQARVKGVFAKVHALSIPEKIGLAQGLIGALNTPEVRADIRLFFKGSPEEHTPAGDRIARAAAAKFVAEVAKRAEIGDETSGKVLQALEGFLGRTLTQRTELRALAQEKLITAWALLTPEQQGRIKAALRFVRGWIKATAAPPAEGG